uniref:Uncharacterized protein n=1 Tax=Panagrolaimus sp. JU765 TaxID=591449 RepID=A0AC34R1E0_9BILA
MLFLAFFLALPAAVASNSVPIPLFMDEMLNSGRKVYDKQSTPTQIKGTPTIVNLSMYIEGLSSFRTQTMDFQLDVYFQQYWVDERLRHNETKRILVRDKEILDKIWHPDIYFANARIAEFHEVTQPNFLLWMEPDGRIFYDTRVSMIVMCSMNLAKWPLDSQQCHLRILSYAYDINQLQIAWILEDPITRNMNIKLSDMRIVQMMPGLCDGNYSTGVWSCVTAEFFVQREIMHHIMQSYVPSSLIVIISWFSFWLDVEAVPARVSLAITTLLTLSTQASNARMALPDVSYTKAIDVWSSTCMIFVFGVMIEFTFCNYVQRKAMSEKSKSTSVRTRKNSIFNNQESSGSNFGIKARNFIGKAMGRNGEQRQLIESCVDEYGSASPSLSDRRVPSTLNAYDNEGLDRSSLSSVRRSKKNDNGPVVPVQSSNPPSFPTMNVSGSVKSNQDDRRREREAERLANWAKTNTLLEAEEITSSAEPMIGGALWHRLRIHATETVSDQEEEQRKHGKHSKFPKVAGIGEKWTTAIKQIQRNKKIMARHEAKRIDQISRWSFPLAFGIFNAVYWLYYLYLS